jgi:hypothetical protein
MAYRKKTATAVGRTSAVFDADGRLVGKERRQLTAAEEAAVRAAWADQSCTMQEVAEAAGIAPALLRHRLRDQLADLPRRGQGAGPKGRFAELSPEEIAQRCAEVRKTWGPERYGLREPTLAEVDARLGRTIERVIPITTDG